MNDHAKGLLITFIGGMILTVDIPLIMLSGGNLWSIVLVRAGCAAIGALVIWFTWRMISPSLPPLLPGRMGVLVASIYGLAAIAFVSAVFYTSAGNLVFILALNSMFAALFSWIMLGEKPARATVITMAVTLGAITLIVSESAGEPKLFGDFCAIMSSAGLGLAMTISRKSGKPMGFAPMIGGIIPVAVAMAIFLTQNAQFQIDEPAWIILNGAVVIPLAFWCLATGPRYLTSPEVAMFYLLETVITPIWVWLIFNEQLSTRTLIGGTIIVLALLIHAIWRLQSKPRKAVSVARSI